MKTKKLCVWLFCRVIDNFGDIGVSWRLARQLAHEQQCDVVLWVDDWSAVQTLLPDVGDSGDWLDGVRVLHWQAEAVVQQLQLLPAADAVIETFACDVPPEVLQWMVGRRVVWLNLEYLTAETWVDGVHLLPSLQSNGVKKYFFCPGFSEQTGGVSFEQTLPLQDLPVSSAEQSQLRAHYHLPEFANSVHVYVFGYADEMWAKWLRMWQCGEGEVTLWLAQGQVLRYLQQGFPELAALQQVGDVVQLGQVRVCVVAFVAQRHFDALLQAADVSVVRGEDSVLRALWQGRVFWWQIYRQEDSAHHDKLHAFWQRCWDETVGLQDAQMTEIWQAFQQLSDELNGVRQLTMVGREQAWQTVLAHQSELMGVLQSWRQTLWSQDSLSTQLANFMRHQLK